VRVQGVAGLAPLRVGELGPLLGHAPKLPTSDRTVPMNDC
jgi:hypothetical protein